MTLVETQFIVLQFFNIFEFHKLKKNMHTEFECFKILTEYFI